MPSSSEARAGAMEHRRVAGASDPAGREAWSLEKAQVSGGDLPRDRRVLGASYLPPAGHNFSSPPDSCLKYYSSSPHDPLGILPPTPQPRSPSMGNCALEGCYEYSVTSDYKSFGKQTVLWKC